LVTKIPVTLDSLKIYNLWSEEHYPCCVKARGIISSTPLVGVGVPAEIPAGLAPQID
jgi:hypothetical protein